MKKYVKFTEGNCNYLTPDRPYKVLRISGTANPVIRSDRGSDVIVMEPGYGMDHHTDSEWQWCDEDGIEPNSAQRYMIDKFIEAENKYILDQTKKG